MSPRTGRPTDEPKIKRVGIRLSEKDSEKLDYCCKKTGLSQTEVIKQGISNIYEQLKKK